MGAQILRLASPLFDRLPEVNSYILYKVFVDEEYHFRYILFQF